MPLVRYHDARTGQEIPAVRSYDPKTRRVERYLTDAAGRVLPAVVVETRELVAVPVPDDDG